MANWEKDNYGFSSQSYSDESSEDVGYASTLPKAKKKAELFISKN